MKFDATNQPVLVVGYGNILRRDDGVGWAAARRLTDQLPADLARVMSVTQLLPELAEPISQSELVIFIDADAELATGKVQKQCIRPDRPRSQTIGHHQSPAGLLCLAGEAFGHVPEASIYTVGGKDFSFGSILSPSVRAALRTLVCNVVDDVLLFSRRREG